MIACQKSYIYMSTRNKVWYESKCIFFIQINGAFQQTGNARNYFLKKIFAIKPGCPFLLRSMDLSQMRRW
jgi:hypothetical protein